MIAAGPRPPRVRVVGQAERHQRGPEVGVAEAELAEGVARLGDLLGRVVGPPDEDLLRREDHLDRVAEGVDVEAVVVEELEQVDRGEIARAVVEVRYSLQFRTTTPLATYEWLRGSLRL